MTIDHKPHLDLALHLLHYRSDERMRSATHFIICILYHAVYFLKFHVIDFDQHSHMLNSVSSRMALRGETDSDRSLVVQLRHSVVSLVICTRHPPKQKKRDFTHKPVFFSLFSHSRMLETKQKRENKQVCVSISGVFSFIWRGCECKPNMKAQ